MWLAPLGNSWPHTLASKPTLWHWPLGTHGAGQRPPGATSSAHTGSQKPRPQLSLAPRSHVPISHWPPGATSSAYKGNVSPLAVGCPASRWGRQTGPGGRGALHLLILNLVTSFHESKRNNYSGSLTLLSCGHHNTGTVFGNFLWCWWVPCRPLDSLVRRHTHTHTLRHHWLQ